MCGYRKDRVTALQNIPDMKAAITAAIRAILRSKCERVSDNFARRIQWCLQLRGADLEHIFGAPVKQRVIAVYI